MTTEFLSRSGPVRCTVLELCSYGDKGDYQVLPARTLDLPLEEIEGWLAEQGTPVRVAEDALLCRWEGVEVMLHKDGRGVLEGVRPDSPAAAWELYLHLLSPVRSSPQAGAPPA